MFNKLQKQVSEVSQSTEDFDWNSFRHVGKGVFQINENTTVTVGLEFANYLSIKARLLFQKDDNVETPTSKELKSLVKGKKWESLEHEVKKIARLIETHGKLQYKSGEEKKQVAVIYNGKIKAVVHHNYSVYPHSQIVEEVEPLKAFVNNFVLDGEKLEVLLKMNDDDTNIRFVVQNGHAGSIGIGYHLRYSVGKFNYKVPSLFVYNTLKHKKGGDIEVFSQRSKHLNNSYQTTDNISMGFEFMQQFSFKAFINAIKITDLRSKLKEFANELYPDDITLDLLIDKAQGKTTYEVLNATALYSNQRGYAVKMKNIITKTLDSFMEV